MTQENNSSGLSYLRHGMAAMSCHAQKRLSLLNIGITLLYNEGKEKNSELFMVDVDSIVCVFRNMAVAQQQQLCPL